MPLELLDLPPELLEAIAEAVYNVSRVSNKRDGQPFVLRFAVLARQAEDPFSASLQTSGQRPHLCTACDKLTDSFTLFARL